MPFLIAFVVVSTVEVVVFTMAWTTIGPAWTIGLTLLTGVVGSYLVRWQGLGVIASVRRSLDEGRFPGRELSHGVMVLVGGALLLTPGFLTDVVGFALMVPMVRDVISRVAEGRLRSRIYNP